MKKQLFKISVQKILGVSLVFFAFNKIFNTIPIGEKEGFVKHFLETLENSQYIMPLIVGIQIAVGFSLIVNRLVALSLLMFLPISLNIFLFHLFHDQKSIVPAMMIYGSNALLIMLNFNKYKYLMLTARE